jgi:probable HAF family extracellular repeat protein
MKYRTEMWMTIVCLFVALAITAQLSAQANTQPKVKHHKYKLVDLGTFGGPMGFISPFGNGAPYINSKGAVVGLAETKTPLPPNSNLYICGPGTDVYHGVEWQKSSGKVTELHALAPNHRNCSEALAINNSDEIAGMSENGVLDPLLGITEIRAVVWKHGKIFDLGTLGGNASQAQSINNHGQVTGFALNDIPDSNSFYGVFFENSTNSTQTRAYSWQKGTMRDIGTLGGPDSFAFFINDSGDIAGISYTASLSVNGFVFKHGKTKMTDTGTLGGTFGGPLALNNKGQFAGQSNLAGDASMHPVFWTGKKLRDLGTFGGSNGAANALNDFGEVAGVADFPGDQLHDAFLWKKGKMTDLGNLGRTSTAYSMNSHGQVVGGSHINLVDQAAFLWERGEMVDLNDLVSPKSDVLLVEPNAIADSGEIAVNGLPKGCTDQDTCEHPYVLIPDGDCDNDCEARITESRNRAIAARDAAAQSSAFTPNRVNGLRDRLTGRYHIPGQLHAPSD